MDIRDFFTGMDAALLDLDGTILDSMREWRACNIDFLESQGVKMTPEQRLRIINSSSGSLLIDYVREELGIEMDIPAFRELQMDRMMRVYRNGVPVKPGAREFMSALRERGIKVVLATATWTDHTLVALNKTGLVPYFDALCCTHLIGKGKNSTEYFDLVSGIIGVPKERCVLFDDAIYALQGARKAGIRGAVAIADPTNTVWRDEMKAQSDAFVESMAELIPLLGGRRGTAPSLA